MRKAFSDQVYGIPQTKSLVVDATLASVLYDHYLDIVVPPETRDAIVQVETRVVQDVFQSRYPLANGITRDGVLRTKFVTRYGVFIAPLTDVDGSRLNRYHLRVGDRVRLCISPKSAWHNEDVCGVAWVVSSLQRIALKESL